MNPSIDVIVTARNQVAVLRILIPQLLSQNYPTDRFCIILVDDCSSDETYEWSCSIKDVRFKYLRLDTNLGRSKARNRALSMSTADVVVLLDGDHTIRSDFLSMHARHYLEIECAVVGASAYPLDSYFDGLSYYLNGCGATKYAPGVSLPGRYFVSGNASMSRSVIEKLGGFDEHFVVWGGEDLDMGMRIAALGISLINEPDAIAFHHHFRTLNSRLSITREYGLRGIPLLLSRHPHLFHELNLDRVLTRADTPSLFPAAYRLMMKLLLISPIFHSVRMFATLFKRIRLPRFIFDYLHWRQYVCGYMDYLKEQKGNTDRG